MKIIKNIFCLCLLLVPLVQAKQLSFTKRASDDKYLFNYHWLDHDKRQQTMSFSLTKQALFERFRMLKVYKGDFAQKAIMREVKKQLTAQPPHGSQAFFLQRDGRMVIQVKGQKEENVALAYQKIKELEQAATTQYFKENYFQAFITPDQQSGVKVDHINIARDSVDDFKALKPIILDKVSVENIRKVTNYVLAFVQSIPYSTLESRITSSGAGFNSPAKLLWENQGDCDSKMTLTATILRALMPRISMVMVYIDKHAFMGIAIPALAGEMTIEHQGVSYVLAEPTGPALYRLGELAPESELAINQGRYVAEAFHGNDTN